MPVFYPRLKIKFYVEGLELDVQDPTFFLDEEKYKIISEAINEILDAYVDLPVDKRYEE